MIQDQFIHSIIEKLESLTPTGLHGLGDELKQNLNAILRESLSKMDIVTREEFDTQSAVLARTRQKLEQLEKEVAQLEHIASQNSI